MSGFKGENAIELLFRIHKENAHRLHTEMAEYYSNDTLKEYETEKRVFMSREEKLEREFVLDFANKIRSMVKEYDSSLDYLLKVPFYVSVDSEGFNYEQCRKMFIDLASGDEKVDEILRERPLLNYFSPIITSVNRFVRSNYDLTSGKIKKEGIIQHPHIIELLLSMMRGFGLHPIINDYLRDCNGNVLLFDQIIAIQCKEVNIAVIISNDLSPNSENEWRNGIIITQIMKRLNKFDYNKHGILFVIHSNQITFFPMFKVQLAKPGYYSIGVGKVLNINSLFDIFDCITFLWQYLCRIASDPHMSFTFLELLSKSEYEQIKMYIPKHYNEECLKEWKRETRKEKQISRAKIAKKLKRKENDMLNSVISEMHKLLQK